METINELIEDCSKAIKALGKDNSPEAIGIAQMKVLNALTKAENLPMWDVGKSLTPHCCPVCGGRGMVHNGFYSQYNGSTMSTAPEVCKTCNSTGVIWG